MNKEAILDEILTVMLSNPKTQTIAKTTVYLGGFASSKLMRYLANEVVDRQSASFLTTIKTLVEDNDLTESQIGNALMRLEEIGWVRAELTPTFALKITVNFEKMATYIEKEIRSS